MMIHNWNKEPVPQIPRKKVQSKGLKCPYCDSSSKREFIDATALKSHTRAKHKKERKELEAKRLATQNNADKPPVLINLC